MKPKEWLIYIIYPIFLSLRYGGPGVEFYGQHESESNVSKMIFLPGQGRLVTLTEDNHLHLWEINGTTLKVDNLIISCFSDINHHFWHTFIFWYKLSFYRYALPYLNYVSQILVSW